MSAPAPDKGPAAPKAEHGTPSEVSWNDGEGRQPYANQGPVEAGPSTGDEAENGDRGDRGERSGRNLQQFDEVRKIP